MWRWGKFSHLLIYLWQHQCYRLHRTFYKKRWRSICVAALTLIFTVGWRCVWPLRSSFRCGAAQGSTVTWRCCAAHTGCDRSVLLAAITSLTLWFPYSIGFKSEILPNRRVCFSLRHTNPPPSLGLSTLSRPVCEIWRLLLWAETPYGADAFTFSLWRPSSDYLLITRRWYAEMN